MRLVRIRSSKYPGAVFLKEANTSDNFICKVYPQKNHVHRNIERNATIETIIKALKDFPDSNGDAFNGPLEMDDDDNQFIIRLSCNELRVLKDGDYGCVEIVIQQILDQAKGRS